MVRGSAPVTSGADYELILSSNQPVRDLLPPLPSVGERERQGVKPSPSRASRLCHQAHSPYGAILNTDQESERGLHGNTHDRIGNRAAAGRAPPRQGQIPAGLAEPRGRSPVYQARPLRPLPPRGSRSLSDRFAASFYLGPRLRRHGKSEAVPVEPQGQPARRS